MSATRDLIAAALTLADEVDDLYENAPVEQNSNEIRELCARAMVQPDMAEVERLLLHFEKRAPWVRHKQRAALLDYVRGVIAERDALIADNERLMQIAAQEVSAAPQPVSEVPMPEPTYLNAGFDGWGSPLRSAYSEDDMRTYGEQCRAADYAAGVADRLDLAHELEGIQADVDQYHNFDATCRNTLARVIAALRGEVK